MTADVADAVVIGAGPNGLVAANVLADAGWDVLVLEAQAEPGGAVRTAELTAPGFRNDVFSAFYPLAHPPAPLARLDLEAHGLAWAQAPAVVAHPRADGPAAVLHRAPEATAAGLDATAPGDGEAWLRLHDRWQREGTVAAAGVHGTVPAGASPAPGRWPGSGRATCCHCSASSCCPCAGWATSSSGATAAKLLLAGNALHADVAPDAAPSGFLGWLLASLAQDVGFPTPVGGAGELTAALVRRLEARGGRLRCGAHVERVVTEGGRAVGVEVAGSPVRARRAVLADVDAEVLLRRLLAPDDLPAHTLAALDGYQRSWATVKVDWALRTPIPWRGRVGGRGRDGAHRGLGRRAGAAGGRHQRFPHPRRPVRGARADDDGRPDPVARRDRVGVGLHPRAVPRA